MTEITVLAGGCFWCLEAPYSRIRGVITATSGYAGGSEADADYKVVSAGKTAHAEAVQIEFDPTVISYEELLDIFWHIHDPTTLNRQGADVGPQYRSEIFTTSEEQKQIAEQSLSAADQSGDFKDKIVTKITPLDEFFKAEDYHQSYYDNNPTAPYCTMVVAPKLKKLLAKYGDKLK